MEEVVRKLVNSGCTLGEIVLQTKLRKVEIMRLCAEMKILTRLRKNNERPNSRRTWAPQPTPKILPKRDRLAAMAQQGKRAKEIAIECGITPQAVYRMAKIAGIELPRRQKERRVRMSKKYGMPMEKVRELRSLGVMKAYIRQKQNAATRGIGWEFSLREWWAIWEASGKWEQRGREKGGYVMGRFGDVGPYAVGNVVICTHLENVLERESHSKRKLKKREEMSMDAA